MIIFLEVISSPKNYQLQKKWKDIKEFVDILGVQQKIEFFNYNQQK